MPGIVTRKGNPAMRSLAVAGSGLAFDVTEARK